MVVYHKTTLEIITHQIILSEIERDFGAAFYTAYIREQAECWAMRKRKLMLRTYPTIKFYKKRTKYITGDGN